MTDPLARQADTLVSAAQIHAVGALAPQLDRFRILKNIESDHWDFIVTIAGVFVGVKRLGDLRLASARESALTTIIHGRLSAWAPDGVIALEDCKRMYEHEAQRRTATGKDPEFVSSDSVGIWAVWNVFGRQPSTDHEIALARAVGLSVIGAFFSWWQTE